MDAAAFDEEDLTLRGVRCICFVVHGHTSRRGEVLACQQEDYRNCIWVLAVQGKTEGNFEATGAAIVAWEVDWRARDVGDIWINPFLFHGRTSEKKEGSSNILVEVTQS